MSFSDGDDASVTSSTKIKEIHVSNSAPSNCTDGNSTLTNRNPPEGKTTVIPYRPGIKGRPMFSDVT